MGINEEPTVAEDDRSSVKTEVQAFYDEVGWQEIGDGLYQNASYEDLRPVSRDYIHRCHMRVGRHLNPKGKFLLDAGSGPIQYPEYLEYSRGYSYRVCADISRVALKEARMRIGEHGLYVVADIANLPFRTEVFDGVVSLHTIHHLPEPEHVKAYQEIYRVMKMDSSGVVVNGWKISPLMRIFEPLVRRLKNRSNPPAHQPDAPAMPKPASPHGTFVNKNNPAWLKQTIGTVIPLQVYCWRSISVGFMRALIQPQFGGRMLLRFIYLLEEISPKFFGEKGQYPLVVIDKSTKTRSKV